MPVNFARRKTICPFSPSDNALCLCLCLGDPAEHTVKGDQAGSHHQVPRTCADQACRASQSQPTTQRIPPAKTVRKADLINLGSAAACCTSLATLDDHVTAAGSVQSVPGGLSGQCLHTRFIG